MHGIPGIATKKMTMKMATTKTEMKKVLSEDNNIETKSNRVGD